MERKMTAEDIQRLLKKRHNKDVYVPECKNGSTWFNEHLRLDGIAIARSWANPFVIGYEIKVERSDFLKDDKVNLYAEYCNQLYYVCPHGLIQPEEVGSHMGLMWASKTGTRIYTEKKAPFDQHEIPSELFKYILISRAKIIDYDIISARNSENDRSYWEEWLKKKEIDRSFGCHVQGAIRKAFDEKVEAVQRKIERMERENETLRKLYKKLEDAGIDVSVRGWGLEKQVDDKIRQIKGKLPHDFDKTLKNAHDYLTRLNQIMQIEGGREKDEH
jgi:hypothetical protein